MGKGKKAVRFRFEDLKIWQLSIQIADELFDIADELERKKLYRFDITTAPAKVFQSDNGGTLVQHIVRDLS